jgi:hypothetical protein
MKMKTKKKIILFLAALSVIAMSLHSVRVAEAAPCSGTCYPTTCPVGTSGLSGDCQTDYMCCNGTPTNYQTGTGTGATGATGAATGSSASVKSPISYDSFSALFQAAMNYLKTVAGIAVIIFIMLGGVMYMASGGHTGMAERAKNTLIYAMVGLVIVVAAPLFLSDILQVLKGSGGSGSSGLLTVATNVLKVLLACIGIFGIMGLMNGAVIMFISSGDEKTIEMARGSVKYSLIAIAMSAGSLILIKTFMAMILTPG